MLRMYVSSPKQGVRVDRYWNGAIAQRGSSPKGVGRASNAGVPFGGGGWPVLEPFNVENKNLKA